MTIFTFANGINTTLASAISSSATSLTLSSSAGLPTSIASGENLVVTLRDAATQLQTEIVYATAVSGATLTVVRAQEGTTAQAWNTGDYAYSGVTAGQMANAVQKASAPHGSVAFGNSGAWSFTVPANVYSVKAQIWGGGSGGGGAGGASTVGYSSGTGGNSGGYSMKYIAVTPGDVLSGNIAQGGGGGGGDGSSGGGGGTTNLSQNGTLLMQATGGTGGIGSPNGAASWPSGSGTAGVGSGGNINLVGGVSVNAFGSFGGGTSFGSSGGSAPFGGVGGSISQGNGQPGNFPGGGGGGAANNNGPKVGGAGANGCVIIEY